MTLKEWYKYLEKTLPNDALIASPHEEYALMKHPEEYLSELFNNSR